MRSAIKTDSAPAAVGPYSQAVRAGRWLFVSGQIALDPATGALVDGDIAAQTRQVMLNIGAVLAAAGSSFEDVVKTTVYLADLDDFSAMNEVYGSFFAAPAPARATIEASRLPRNAKVEIEAIARLSHKK